MAYLVFVSTKSEIVDLLVKFGFGTYTNLRFISNNYWFVDIEILFQNRILILYIYFEDVDLKKSNNKIIRIYWLHETMEQDQQRINIGRQQPIQFFKTGTGIQILVG